MTNMAQDSYTMKEMITEMRLDQREVSQRAARMEQTLSNIDEHLKNLNSKVATNVKAIAKNEEDINSFKTLRTQAMLVWSVLIFVAVSVGNKVLAQIGF